MSPLSRWRGTGFGFWKMSIGGVICQNSKIGYIMVLCLLRHLKGAFHGINIIYYNYLTYFRRAAKMELQPQLGLRPNWWFVIITGNPVDTGIDGIYSPRLLSN